MLDDIVLSIDEMEEQKQTERDERTSMDQRLHDAGQEIRNRAVGIAVQRNNSEIIEVTPITYNELDNKESKTNHKSTLND